MGVAGLFCHVGWYFDSFSTFFREVSVKHSYMCFVYENFHNLKLRLKIKRVTVLTRVVRGES